MFVCSLEENIQELEKDHIYEFPNLRKKSYSTSLANLSLHPVSKNHILKVESKSSRECSLEFFNTRTNNVLPIHLKFNHIHDSYKIELQEIFDEDSFYFRITNKTHVLISCTRMFQKTKYPIQVPLGEKKDHHHINDVKNDDIKNVTRIKDHRDGRKKDNDNDNIRDLRLIGFMFVLIQYWRYYRIPFSHKKIKESPSPRDPRDQSNNKKKNDPVQVLLYEFLPIVGTFLIDYYPSFKISTCDAWLSHVINSSIRSFNEENHLSIPDDIDIEEFLNSITPQLYPSKQEPFKFRSEANNLICSALNIDGKDCAMFIRESYLYLLGDDESMPFKPIQELFQKIKFIKQHVKDILIAMFRSYTRFGLIQF